jgi:hypothetical protein
MWGVWDVIERDFGCFSDETFLYMDGYINKESVGFRNSILLLQYYYGYPLLV